MNPTNTNERIHKQEKDMVDRSVSVIVKKIKKAKLDDKTFSPLYCKVCSFYGNTSEDLTTHLKSIGHAQRVSTLASSKTLVWWDINSCPVPDARLVVPIIKRELEKSGFSGGHLTITAISDLKQTPYDVLQAISSSGILLIHEDEQCLDIMCELFRWTSNNPPPATVMLITDDVKPFTVLTGRLQKKGYAVILYHDWIHLWPLAVEINGQQATKARCNETSESAWCCILCRNCHELYDDEEIVDGESFNGERFDGKCFEDFTMHFQSRGHKLSEWLFFDTPLTSERPSPWFHPKDATTMADTPLISSMQPSCLHPNEAKTLTKRSVGDEDAEDDE